MLRCDVDEAYRLMRVATQTAATDPRTGTIDMDMISTGRTAVDRDLISKLVVELRDMLGKMNGGMRITVGQLRQNILRNMNGGNNNFDYSSNYTLKNNNNIITVSMNDLEAAVKELQEDGVVQYIERTQTIIVKNQE